MRQVRQLVFETNSSSTHCMCIVSDRRAELVYPEHLTFRCKEYGRESGELRSAEDKASYLYSSILSLFERKKAETAKSWIMDELGKVGVECDFETPEYRRYGSGVYCYNAYIDHAGEDDHLTFVEGVLRSSGRLLRYLFSDKSVVLTTSDEIDDDRVYDITGDCTEEYNWSRWPTFEDISWERHIVRDCILFKEDDEDGRTYT